MEELRQAITKMETETTPEKVNGREHFLRDAAEDWADHSIRTFQGELLKKALLISAAMADFVSELESQ